VPSICDFPDVDRLPDTVCFGSRNDSVDPGLDRFSLVPIDVCCLYLSGINLLEDFQVVFVNKSFNEVPSRNLC